MKTASYLTAALAACAIAGCAGNSSTAPFSGVPQSPQQLLRGRALPSGIVPQHPGWAMIPSRIALPDRHRHKAPVEKDFFVSDAGNSLFELKNATYGLVGTITAGLNGSDGVWVDKKGNVYVANFGNASVTEYKKGHGAPTCTYSSGLVDPINVTGDNAGNVYVVDFNLFQTPGHVDKFAQCKNSIVKEYDVDSGPEGAAIDASGNIFVSYLGPDGGDFLEFKGGSMTPTQLGATVGGAGGLIIDKKGVLVADDQNGSVDLIAPPYSTATPFATGLLDPFHLALNKAETRLFSANSDAFGSTVGTVTVYAYPSGTLLRTITEADGIDGAYGVGESPNAVF